MKASPGVADHPERILVVDDERRNRQLLEVMLAPEGYLLQTAGGGEEALAMVARELPDLILLDIMMPGMDGYEVARRIKGDPATRNIPVIMITALDDRNARMLGLGAGAEDFLTKPVDRAELCVRVRNLLRLKAYGDYFDTYSQKLECEVGARTADLVSLTERMSLANAVAKVGVWELDLASNAFTWDATMFGIYGLEAVVPLPYPRWSAAVHPEDLPAVEATWQRTLDEQGEGAAKFRIIVADGTVRNISSVARAILDERSGGRRLIGVDMDVTHELALEAQLRQSQKMEAVGKLAAGVAHDFNNLLQALLSQLQALSSRAGDDDRLQSAVRECEAVVARGAVLTRQLLLFSRHEAMRTERIELNELLRQDTVLLRSLLRENVALAMELAQDHLWVEGDRGQLDQVVMNLAVNACDAMPAGGRLIVRSGREAGGAVWFSVRDTGTGIPAGIRERIFEPFFTTKDAGKGTGLGLSVVHGIVTHHGGHIDVDTEPGAGASFRIVLPAASAGELPVVAVEKAAAAFGVGRGERVLVVEDEEGARNGLRELLSLMGYEVVTAGSGEEAGVLPDSPAFDLLLTDLVLPGIGGGDVAASAAARWPGLKVILMSGYTEDEAMRHLAGARTACFLQKPFGAEKLARKVRGALDEAR